MKTPDPAWLDMIGRQLTGDVQVRLDEGYEAEWYRRYALNRARTLAGQVGFDPQFIRATVLWFEVHNPWALKVRDPTRKDYKPVVTVWVADAVTMLGEVVLGVVLNESPDS